MAENRISCQRTRSPDYCVCFCDAVRRARCWRRWNRATFSARLASSTWTDWISKWLTKTASLNNSHHHRTRWFRLCPRTGWFGSHCCFSMRRRTADVRSVGYAELFSLSREDVLTAMKDYPEAEVLVCVASCCGCFSRCTLSRRNWALMFFSGC